MNNLFMNRKNWKMLLLCLTVPLVFTACGGGGGGGGTGSTADTTRPTVSSINPANGSTNVPVNTGISAGFSEAMDYLTVTNATFTVSNSVGNISGAVSCSGTTATFTPSANLGDNTTYTATITTAAKDSAGNALATNYSWTFTTGVAPDITAPTNTTASNFINGGATVAALNSISLSISATDDVGVSAYYASESSTAPSASDSGWTAITATTSYSANVSYSPASSGEATKTVYVWFKDASGNISASASDSITVVMGGSVQSAPLNLTSTNATVTTFVGSAGVVGSTDGTGTEARLNAPYNITTDGTNLFVADTWNNTIRKVVISTGAVTTIASSAGLVGSTDGTGAAARFNTPTGITTDGLNLFVADTYNHTIRKIVISTGAVTTIAGSAGLTGSTDGIGTVARFNNPWAITTEGTNLFVVDNGNNTIRKIVISTGAVTTIAGSAGLSGSTDGTGTAARFSNPDSITTDGTNLFVADTANYTIRKIVISTGVVTTIAGSAGLAGSTDGTGTAARFSNPWGITTDGTNLFVADAANYSIRKIVISTGVVTTIAGSAGLVGSTDGTGTAARFFNPYGITTDGTNLFVADNGNLTIRKIQPTVLIGGAVQGAPLNLTNTVTTFAGLANNAGTTDGTGTVARFNTPCGATTDGTNLFITDGSNHTIRKIVMASGAVTTIAGSAGAIGSTDGTGTAARFNGPADITTDGTNLFLSDTDNNTIRKVVISTGVVTTIAGSAGLAGSTDGTGTAVRFYAPRGITTDGTNLFVADRGNHTIRKIVISTGAVSTIAGSAGLTGSTDATGTAARFNLPHGITTDGTSLFVADLSNHTIRKVVISTGVVTTVAGSAGLVGSTDGTGSTARFNQPGGLTTDGTNLYVSDCWNHIIRKIVLSTGAVSTIAGSAGLNGTTDGTGSIAKFYMPVGITTDGTNLFVCDYWNYTIRRIQ